MIKLQSDVWELLQKQMMPGLQPGQAARECLQQAFKNPQTGILWAASDVVIVSWNVVFFPLELTNDLTTKRKELQKYIDNLKEKYPTKVDLGKKKMGIVLSPETPCLKNVFLPQFSLPPICTTSSKKHTRKKTKKTRQVAQLRLRVSFSFDIIEATNLTNLNFWTSLSPELRKQLEKKAKEYERCQAEIKREFNTS